MAATEKDIWAELRKPFPKEAVGKLKTSYGELDYVGHAAVTDRLNSVDPMWTWEPMATTADGLPLLDDKQNLWIRLTVGGVTRIGVGDGKNMKELIGDALRNAAMRFGVALDLWSKDELESNIAHPENRNIKGADTLPSVVEELPVKQIDEDVDESVGVDMATVAKLYGAVKMKGVTVKTEASNILNNLAKTRFNTDQLIDLSEAQAMDLYGYLCLPATKLEALKMLTEES